MSKSARHNAEQRRVTPGHRPARDTSRHARGGYLLLEVAAATLLLTAVMMMTAGAVRLRLATARHAQQQQLALEEANNLLERLTAGSPQSVSTGGATPARESPATSETSQLSAAALMALPDAKLRVTVNDDQLGLRRVRVEIDWQLRSGQRSRAVTLIGWAPASRPTTAEGTP